MARVTISPRMPVGPQGAAAPEVQVQYSADGTNWHNTPQSGDMYLRFSTDGGDTWGESIRLAEVAIDDQITDGVTDRAPSQNAVYDALQALQGSVEDQLQDYVLLSDYEDADVLAKVKNVDGENSGLDADLVRGLPADFTCSKTQNGYTKLPNGLIIQWGAGDVPANTVNYAVTLPIAFPNAILRAVATSVVISTENASNVGLGTSAPTTTTVYLGNANADTLSIRFIAIGY